MAAPKLNQGFEVTTHTTNCAHQVNLINFMITGTYDGTEFDAIRTNNPVIEWNLFNDSNPGPIGDGLLVLDTTLIYFSVGRSGHGPTYIRLNNPVPEKLWSKSGKFTLVGFCCSSDEFKWTP